MSKIEPELIAFPILIFITRYMNGTNYKTEIRASKSIAEFKRKLIALVRPVKNTIYGVSVLKGIRNITKLRVQFSDLNAHNMFYFSSTGML